MQDVLKAWAPYHFDYSVFYQAHSYVHEKLTITHQLNRPCTLNNHFHSIRTCNSTSTAHCVSYMEAWVHMDGKRCWIGKATACYFCLITISSTWANCNGEAWVKLFQMFLSIFRFWVLRILCTRPTSWHDNVCCEYYIVKEEIQKANALGPCAFEWKSTIWVTSVCCHFNSFRLFALIKYWWQSVWQNKDSVCIGFFQHEFYL